MFQLFGVVVVVYHWSLTVLCIGHTMHKYEIRSVRNTVPPNLRRFRGEIQMQISMRKKSDFTPKQIHVTVSLNLRSWVSPLWLWGRFRHFVMNLSDFFWLQTRVNAHGRDNQSFPTSLVPKKWLYLASTFFAPALRGSPHSSQNQIQIQITNLMMRRAGLSTFRQLRTWVE